MVNMRRNSMETIDFENTVNTYQKINSLNTKQKLMLTVLLMQGMNLSIYNKKDLHKFFKIQEDFIWNNLCDECF